MKQLTDLTELFLSGVDGFETQFTDEQKTTLRNMFISFAKAVEKWIVEDYSGTVQDWVIGEFVPCLRLHVGDDLDIKNGK